MATLRPCVIGIDLDPETRCAHYCGALDIVAIKMKCCGVYYACKDCHDALADHAINVWPVGEWNQAAVLCGVCGAELTVRQYLGCSDKCPRCSSPFNPGCRNHYHFYFEIGEP
ncbi:MAG TPA: CHY zinc finger protein [Terracidiphilus sp.]